MGLCKCTKRKATNLFCFEHRVNVCDYCLVDAHESCVVQTYLSWLTDSDYDPKCLLCAEPLAAKETIRLKCLHNFHWSCLSTRIGHMPDGTPAGAYKCPSCLDTIFPAYNETSPVVERLKSKLCSVNWARVGLGLEPRPGMEAVTEATRPALKQTFSVDMNNYDSGSVGGNSGGSVAAASYAENRQKSGRIKAANSDSVQSLHPKHDTDLADTKYVKRNNAASKLRLSRLPRYVKRVGLVVLCLIFFYIVLMMFGRETGDNVNPVFDPHLNPNIRVE